MRKKENAISLSLSLFLHGNRQQSRGTLFFCFLADQHWVCTRHVSAAVFWHNVIDEAGKLVSMAEEKDTKGFVCGSRSFSICYPSVWLVVSHFLHHHILFCDSLQLLLCCKKKNEQIFRLGKMKIFWAPIYFIVRTQRRGKPQIIKGNNINEYEKWKLGLQRNWVKIVGILINYFVCRLYKWDNMKHHAC